MITFTGPLKLWRGEGGGSHFMSVPDESGEIFFHAMENPRGFRSVKVEARIGDVTWRTSVFPVKSGGYFLPVKIDVCRKAGILEDEEVTVELKLL
jgi:Domain of unknown function (DUF1905)